MTKLDTKFYGEIRKAKDGSLVPDDQYVVFLAKDNAFAAALSTYRGFCYAMGADALHLEAVDSLIERVEAWREAHPDQCKVPDVGPNEKLLPSEIAAAEPMHDAGVWIPTHQHYKGTLYRELRRWKNTTGTPFKADTSVVTDFGQALVTDDLEYGAVAVIYQNARGETFLRPAVIFDGVVWIGAGPAKQRFRPV